MRTKNSLNSYHEGTAQQYLTVKKPIINVSSEIEVQYNWIDGKRTDEITGYKLYFSQEGVTLLRLNSKRNPRFQHFYQK